MSPISKPRLTSSQLFAGVKKAGFGQHIFDLGILEIMPFLKVNSPRPADSRHSPRGVYPLLTVSHLVMFCIADSLHSLHFIYKALHPLLLPPSLWTKPQLAKDRFGLRLVRGYLHHCNNPRVHFHLQPSQFMVGFV